MSASDAAPLPRLGEVFFDVRGESRSMRLSWYADTGVAVFSIWQGGTCTGTFRLPIADLPRMVEALQRGPHGRDDPVMGEQPAAREPRLPAAPAGPGPARPAQPELLDSDIKTGQTTAAIYLPPVESDLTGYQAEPPLPGYADEPPGGYPGGPLPEGPDDDYQASPPQEPGYRSRAPRRRREAPPAPGLAGEPAHRHSGDGLAGPGEYGAEPLPPDFTGEYGAEPLPPDFTGEYGAEPLPPDFTGEYGAEPLPPDFTGEYQAPPAPGYPGDAPAGYGGEPGTAGYPDEPADGYLGEQAGPPGYPGGPLGTDPGGLPDPPLADDYPRERPREGRGGRPPSGRSGQAGWASRARRGSHSSGPADAPGGYPADPPPGGYPGEQDYQPYPEELAAAEYGSPARPYMEGTPGTDEPLADDQPERRKPRSRRRAEPAPDSFPYGPPPTADAPRQRGRYPGRH